MPFTHWSPSQVVDWVGSLNPAFKQAYSESLLNRKIDGEGLAVLTIQRLTNDLPFRHEDATLIWAALENLKKSEVTKMICISVNGIHI